MLNSDNITINHRNYRKNKLRHMKCIYYLFSVISEDL